MKFRTRNGVFGVGVLWMVVLLLAGCAPTNVSRDVPAGPDRDYHGGADRDMVVKRPAKNRDRPAVRKTPQRRQRPAVAPPALVARRPAAPVPALIPPKLPKMSAGRTNYGKASYYGKKFHGRRTASGEVYNQFELTAAHRTLPFGTVCRVTNLSNGKSVRVRINDRGPFVKGRIIDLSYRASQVVEGIRAGVFDVKIEILEYGKK